MTDDLFGERADKPSQHDPAPHRLAVQATGAARNST